MSESDHFLHSKFFAHLLDQQLDTARITSLGAAEIFGVRYGVW